jgi:guanine nucleotide-binding protein subunit alpha
VAIGAGESGKSTFIKQMRIIHSNGFQDGERSGFKGVIYSNMVLAFRLLLEIMRDEGLAFADEKTKMYSDLIETTDHNLKAEQAFTNNNIREAMLGMWHDHGVQRAVAKSHEFALNDSLNFYFQKIERMFDPAWIPDDQDILHARLRTTGVTETLFEVGNLKFRMVDVGGQRSERKKWIHCFEGVQCLMFMVALSGYNQCLLEDQNANQMYEAMVLFESLINGMWFKNKPVILFFNKIDLFREKLRISPISTYFPDYAGEEGDEEAARGYFAERFRAINQTAGREIYIHYTDATDTNLLRNTIQSVQHIIIQKNLQQLSL